MFTDEDGNSNYLNLPKVGGEPIIATFTAIRRVNEENNDKNFKSLPDKNWGFHYIITFNGTKEYTLNTWKLFYALKEAKVYEGDTIKISHPERGVWKVEVMTTDDENVKELIKETVQRVVAGDPEKEWKEREDGWT